MSRDGFDLSELDEFTSQMLDLAERKMPREVRKFMRTEGTKLRRVTVSTARRETKKRTGTYIKGIKRGKVYVYEGDTLSVRVYNSSPHAHLIEDGHRQVTRGGRAVGFVRGKRVFAKAQRAFEAEFLNDCMDFVDELLEKGLK